MTKEGIIKIKYKENIIKQKRREKRKIKGMGGNQMFRRDGVRRENERREGGRNE